MKQTNKTLFVVFVVAMVTASGCSKTYKQRDYKPTQDSTKPPISQLIDIDDNEYKTVKIGTQEWMAENLNVEHYLNGDVIPQVQGDEDWSKLKIGAWCYYENETEKGITYGKLYNWYAVADPRGLAPVGWHIPSDDEWTQLTNYLGGDTVAGGKLKATTVWLTPNADVTNESDFTALPGGVRADNYGYFDYVGLHGSFWSSSEYLLFYAWFRVMVFDNLVVDRAFSDKPIGMSVRCVRD